MSLVPKSKLDKLLMYELGIFAEANASKDSRIDDESLEELSNRYGLSKRQLRKLEDEMSALYVRVVID